MRVIAVAAAAADNGFDWTKLIGLIGIPAAILALATLVVGVIHPIAVQKPRYWHDGGNTRISLAIKNRSPAYDRNVERIVIYKVPGFWKRTFTRKWRSQPTSVSFIPWGDLPSVKVPTTLGKRTEREFEFELRTPDGRSASFSIDKTYRVEAKSGKRRSRGKKIKPLKT